MKAVEGDLMYQFKYTFSEHDYLEFCKFNAFNTPEGKKHMLRYRNTFVIIFLFSGIAFGSIGAITNKPFLFYSYLIGFGILIVLWLIFFKRIMEIKIKRDIERLKQSGKLPYSSNVTICFKDDYIVKTSEDAESTVKYSAIERVLVTEKALYIYINATQAFVMPATLFYDVHKRDDFIKFLEEKRVAIK